MRQSCRLRWEKINIKRYGGSPAALFFVDAVASRIGLTLAERFNVQIRVEKTVYLCLRESCIDTFHVTPFDYTRNLLAK